MAVARERELDSADVKGVLGIVRIVLCMQVSATALGKVTKVSRACQQIVRRVWAELVGVLCMLTLERTHDTVLGLDAATLTPDSALLLATSKPSLAQLAQASTDTLVQKRADLCRH
eukprot:317438-Amphidinium_carterae.1